MVPISMRQQSLRAKSKMSSVMCSRNLCVRSNDQHGSVSPRKSHA